MILTLLELKFDIITKIFEINFSEFYLRKIHVT